jgi:hypothetical protein
MLLAIFVLKLVNKIVDKPYMDKPFHINVAKHYCKEEYHYWNGKVRLHLQVCKSSSKKKRKLIVSFTVFPDEITVGFFIIINHRVNYFKVKKIYFMDFGFLIVILDLSDVES